MLITISHTQSTLFSLFHSCGVFWVLRASFSMVRNIRPNEKIPWIRKWCIRSLFSEINLHAVSCAAYADAHLVMRNTHIYSATRAKLIRMPNTCVSLSPIKLTHSRSLFKASTVYIISLSINYIGCARFYIILHEHENIHDVYIYLYTYMRCHHSLFETTAVNVLHVYGWCRVDRWVSSKSPAHNHWQSSRTHATSIHNVIEFTFFKYIRTYSIASLLEPI